LRSNTTAKTCSEALQKIQGKNIEEIEYVFCRTHTVNNREVKSRFSIAVETILKIRCCFFTKVIMKRKLLYSIFILLFVMKVHAQRQAKIDSLLAVIPYSHDTTKVDQLLSLSDLCFQTSEDSALLFAHEALSLSKQIRNTAWIGYSCWALSDIHTQYGSHLDSALYYGELAKNNFAEVHDSIRLARMFQSIGYILEQQNNITLASLYTDSAATIFFYLKDTAGCIESLLRKLEYSTSDKRYGEARTIINEIRTLCSQSKRSNYWLSRTNSYFGSFYLEIGENDSAVYYLDKALTRIVELKDARGISYTSGRLGVAYSKIHNWEKAIYYAQKGLQLAQQNNFVKETGDNLNDLYLIYKAKGDAENALKYYEKYSALEDSLNASSQKTSLDKVNLELANVKNVDRIELLKKDNEVQQSEVARQKLIRNGVLGSLVVVLGFTFLFFFQRNRISRERNAATNCCSTFSPKKLQKNSKQPVPPKQKASMK
jgi:tetratricopeptide (TPR) repeat protein